MWRVVFGCTPHAFARKGRFPRFVRDLGKIWYKRRSYFPRFVRDLCKILCACNRAENNRVENNVNLIKLNKK